MSSPGVMEYAIKTCVFVKYILGYVPPSRPGAQAKKPTKNQRYHIWMSGVPHGIVCTSDIVPALMQMKYEYHDLLALEDVTKESYLSVVSVEGALIDHILQY